ncbi:MAG TPA: endopeptidase La, partial [candidate division Zixibacteria bacterium]|nr:endopeptidase La [candidate division Zixibacteria bacterium]
VVDEITHLDPSYSPEQVTVLKMNQKDPSLLADRAASIFHFPLPAKQEILESVDLSMRYDRLLASLNSELMRVATAASVNENVRRNMAEEERRVFLRQQLAEIRRQLGEDPSEEREAAALRHQIKSSNSLPPDVVARATIEIDRLSELSPASAEYGVTKNYLNWLLSLPWGKVTPEDYSMAEVARVLSAEHYGPTQLKEQILQRLSVRKLLGGTSEGPTLCLIGAPGTGKASLAKAMAKAMGKRLVRISVGGISEVSEIKGSPRTFLGAMPGKIVRAMRDAGSCDPVVLIEDIDYFNMDNDSSVNMVLLEAIDSRWNKAFLDNYLGVPFDLSKAFFICSVRSFEEIPEQFVPRLDIIELPAYIEKEKIVISKKYIIPKMLRKHGLSKAEVEFETKALTRIISNYTMEAGLLVFSQQIEKILRKIALEKAEKPRKNWVIRPDTIELYLGQPVFIPEKAETKPEIGCATGLAWTGAGGDLMFIEGLKMKGDGQIITTGSLGDVMRESIQAAHSYVRSKADVLGIDFNDFNEFDIHIHFPSGAIPKDGPSAGITVCLVIASLMAERPIRNEIAMTGEVTLRGRVLPVGGIKEKVSAAYRAGILTVVLPKENEKDLKDLPKEILRRTAFRFIERVDELFELCLLDFTPSAYTLEKIFAEEIEKAKRRSSAGKAAARKVSKKPGGKPSTKRPRTR